MAVKFVGLEQLKYFYNKIKDSFAAKSDLPKTATNEFTGLVKPDGKTITVTDDGQLSVAELNAYLKREDAESLYLSQTSADNKYETKETGETHLTKEEASTTYAQKSELDKYIESEQVASDIQTAKQDLEEKIKAAISSVYTAKGSTTFLELPEPSAETEGNVYNITDEFTVSDTEKWTEGSEGKHSAGTNVVVIKEGEQYKWDILGGDTDLTNYVTTETLSNYVQTSQLSNYATKDSLNDYVQESALTNYVTNSSLGTTLEDYVTNESLSQTYATKLELDAYLKIADVTAISNEEIDTIFAE